ALFELSQAVRCPQRRPSADDDHELLVGEVEVIGISGLAGWYLPHAVADQLTAQLVTDARTPAAKAAWSLTLLEGRPVDVRHELESTGMAHARRECSYGGREFVGGSMPPRI